MAWTTAAPARRRNSPSVCNQSIFSLKTDNYWTHQQRRYVSSQCRVLKRFRETVSRRCDCCFEHLSIRLRIRVSWSVCVCVYGFYGAYNYSGLVRQVSGFSNVVSVRRVHVVLWLLDLRAEESRVVRHVKPPRCGEESSRPHALSLVRTQAIGALAPGSYLLSYPSSSVYPLLLEAEEQCSEQSNQV